MIPVRGTLDYRCVLHSQKNALAFGMISDSKLGIPRSGARALWRFDRVPKDSTLWHCTLSGKHHQIDGVGHPFDLTTRGLTDAEGALGVFYRP